MVVYRKLNKKIKNDRNRNCRKNISKLEIKKLHRGVRQREVKKKGREKVEKKVEKVVAVSNIVMKKSLK